jgi:hypothetical protein
MKEEDAVIITLYHHGTTISSPWGICHFYSSLHSGHYLQVVAAKQGQDNTSLDSKWIKMHANHSPRGRLLILWFEQFGRITRILSIISNELSGSKN